MNQINLADNIDGGVFRHVFDGQSLTEIVIAPREIKNEVLNSFQTQFLKAQIGSLANSRQRVDMRRELYHMSIICAPTRNRT